MKNIIESLLFISHKPLTAKEVAKLIGATVEEAGRLIEELFNEYEAKKSGIRLAKLGDKYQMTSSPEASEVVNKFVKGEITGELTKPSLEALTVIAYRGPISKAELELIRGVNCSMILRNLMMRGLVEAKEDEKKQTVLYAITFDFLKYLGFSRVEELPDFEKLNRNNNLDKLLAGLAPNNANISEVI